MFLSQTNFSLHYSDKINAYNRKIVLVIFSPTLFIVETVFVIKYIRLFIYLYMIELIIDHTVRATQTIPQTTTIAINFVLFCSVNSNKKFINIKTINPIANKTIPTQPIGVN